MMYPYAEFLLDFDRKHGQLTHANAPENTRAAVIIEARPFFFLPKVIRNAMFFLGPSWNLYVFCSEISHDYAQSFLQGWSVRVTKLRTARLSIEDYSGILTSPTFWQGFTEEKVLVFQTDSILTGSNIDDFMEYDFIGAPCGQFDEQFVVNGGLSLRSRSAMLDVVSRFRLPDGMPEDIFFTGILREIGARMPNLATATRFAVESLYSEHPVGVHGTDKCYHSVEVAEKITRATRY